jgi:hypothetical protein
MPKIGAFVRERNAVARRAAYISLDASPAESKIGRSLIAVIVFRGIRENRNGIFALALRMPKVAGRSRPRPLSHSRK